MAAVIPKGFEVVPDERLPNVPSMAQAPDPLEGIPEGGEAQVGAWNDGSPKIRKNLGGGRFIEGTYDDNGQWSAVAEITGSDVPEGFEPLPTDLPFGSGEQGESSDGSELLDDEQVSQPKISAGGAAWRGLQSNALMGFDDELQGAAGAVGNKVGQWLGMNETEIPFSEVYKQIRDKARDEKDAAYDQHMLAYGAGALPGMIISAPFIGGKVAQGGTALRTAGNLAAAGARGGAVSGAGNSEDELGLGTIGDMAEGAAIGGAVAPVLAPVASGVARGVGAVRDIVRPNNTLNSGLEVLSRQAGDSLDPAAMRAAAADMEAAGVPPRLVDALPAQGRAVVRTQTHRNSPAREDLEQHTREVYNSMADRVTAQANRHISDAPGTARGLSRQIAEEQRAMGPQFDAVRNEPVEITPEIIQAFSTAEGRSALRAVGRDLQPEEAAQLHRFMAAVNTATRQIDPRLPPRVREQLERQIFADSPLTVDIADKFARVSVERGKANPSRMRAARGYAETLRGAAREQYPEYGAALDEFAARARVGDAAEGTGRFEGSDFLKTPPDEFAAVTGSASRAPAAGAPAPTALEPVDEAMTRAARAHTAGDEQFAESVNAYLRDPENYTSNGWQAEREFVESYLHNMERLIRNSPMSRGATLQRGMVLNADELDTMLSSGAYNMRKPASFTSDSRIARDYANTDAMEIGDPDIDNALRSVVVEVDAPAGTLAADLDNISGDDLKEFALSGTVPILRSRNEGGVTVVTLDGTALARRAAPQPTISEADAIRMRARDDVVDRASGGRGGANALGVADQLATGRYQRMRNQQLLGEEGAQNLERGMNAEVQRYQNTSFIDPNRGSKTSSVEGDAADLMLEGANAMANLKTAGIWGAVRSASQFLRNVGVRGVDTERLVRDAISEDPARLRASIDFLEQRGLDRARARSLMRSIAATAGGRMGGNASYDRPDQPRSGRSITNSSRAVNQGAD